jgi:hypothetical protein
MSNLRDIMTDIQVALRHGVNVKAERKELIRRINRHQRRLCTERHWSWLQKLWKVQLKEAITITSWATTTSAYALTFTVPTDWTGSADRATLEGAVVTFTLAATGTEYSFVIEAAELALSTYKIVLDPTFFGTGTMVGDETLTISWPRYALPHDLSDVYEFMLRDDDAGPLHELTLDQEAWYMLNEDDPTGIPSAFMLSPNRLVTNDLTIEDAPQNTFRQMFLPPPVDPMTLAVSGSGSSFSANEVYEYAYAWGAGGMFSGLSPSVEITIATNGQQVDISDLETWGTDASTRYGRQKYIFRRRVYSDRFGPWYMVSEINSFTSTDTDTGAYDPLTAARFNHVIQTYPITAVRRWVRFYPLTDQDRHVELRYLSTVPDMYADTDVPYIPEFAHDILVHEVVAEMAAEADAPAVRKHHERMAREVRKNLARRESGSKATSIRKSSIFANGRPGLRFNQATWNE